MCSQCHCCNQERQALYSEGKWRHLAFAAKLVLVMAMVMLFLVLVHLQISTQLQGYSSNGVPDTTTKPDEVQQEPGGITV